MGKYLRLGLAIAGILGVVLLVASCTGPAGLAGPPGAPGTSSGTVSGTVTNSLTKAPVAGVAITTDPAIKDVTITSGADGSYTVELPIGSYTLTFKKANFTDGTQTAVLVAGQTVTKDVVLKPVKAVAVNVGTAQTSSPGGSATLRATAEPLDGSTVQSYKWTQTAGVNAKMDSTDSDTVTITLGDAKSYKDELLTVLNPLARLTVLAINPHSLAEAETATFKVTVTTSSGSYSGTVNVVASLPYVVSSGISNVPIGEPVLVHNVKQNFYDWALTLPEGSQTAFDDKRIQNPAFTPDVAGKYVLTEKVTGAKLTIYAGTWAGAITGQDTKGRPVAAGCTVCHDGKTAPDKFTAWKESGHAEIFTQNINDPAGHWAITCASCHTVGYDPGVTNGGFDEAVAAEGWKVPPHGEVGLYTEILKDYPKTASLSNIQCENCHGPNNSPAHANKEAVGARMTVSSDGCATCHGEPPRHGRFQQWEESRHGGTDTTPARATSPSCARCHSAQGFLLWLEQGDMTKQIQGAKGNATAAEMTAMGFTADKLEPVTCVACHDPHAQGTISSDPTNATVRVVGETAKLPAGFQATVVGKGALCMTCHNTRNDVHNVDAPPTSYSAPHTAAQADVLMGENAYFVAVGQRSPHSYIQDTCVTCHMEKTPPPEGYTQTGTNHGFKASLDSCAECHSNTLNAEALQAGVEEKVEELKHAMGKYLLEKLPASITVKDYTLHTFGGKSYDVLSNAVVITKDNIASVESTEPHGQQGFIIELKTAVSVTYAPAGESPHTLSLTELEVQLGSITTDGTKAIIAFTDPLVRAGWNFFLIEGDNSFGIHNPAFSMEVLEAAIEALK